MQKKKGENIYLYLEKGMSTSCSTLSDFRALKLYDKVKDVNSHVLSF